MGVGCLQCDGVLQGRQPNLSAVAAFRGGSASPGVATGSQRRHVATSVKEQIQLRLVGLVRILALGHPHFDVDGEA